jgi:hypothetical protein
LAVCGDVDHNKVFEQIEQKMGDWQPSGFDPFEKYPIPAFKPIEYAKQFVVESPNAQVPVFMLTYHGPDTRNDLKSTYAADIFSTILQQKNVKLYKELVETGLAFQVQVGYQSAKFVGPIQIFMVPNPRKIKEAYQVLWNNINAWDSDDYFTDEQLQTAKDQMAVSEAYSMEKPSQFIHGVTFWWCSATIGYYTNYQDNLQKITREDIKNYVRKYIKGQPYVMGAMVRTGMQKSLKMDEFFASTLAMPEYTLNFNMNETVLTAEENASKLNSLIQWLNINPSANIDVSATWHDGEKKTAGNERYEAILKALADAGIAPTRIIGTNNKKFQIKQVNVNTDDEKTAARNITFSIVKK